mmetsp:Transcript_24051/g.63603  ORF Transcript_24051/g.63603 Transcript_24051/m.63603 type:complete len:180 (-) Transcript_24051:988-1527(-)
MGPVGGPIGGVLGFVGGVTVGAVGGCVICVGAVVGGVGNGVYLIGKGTKNMVTPPPVLDASIEIRKKYAAADEEIYNEQRAALYDGLFDDHAHEAIKTGKAVETEFYDLLGVTPDATEAQIRRAFYKRRMDAARKSSPTTLPKPRSSRNSLARTKCSPTRTSAPSTTPAAGRPSRTRRR